LDPRSTGITQVWDSGLKPCTPKLALFDVSSGLTGGSLVNVGQCISSPNSAKSTKVSYPRVTHSTQQQQNK
ncbi:hypothetical protein HAX54_021587, partial [Datura stramonium]|nr:hypothetical protein [Datura stramonium]